MIQRKYSHDEVTELCKAFSKAFLGGEEVTFEPDGGYDSVTKTDLAEWDFCDFGIDEIVEDGEIKYSGMIYYHSYGSFNPRDGGTPPETDITELKTSHKDPGKALVETAMIVLGNSMNEFLSDQQMERIAREESQ